MLDEADEDDGSMDPRMAPSAEEWVLIGAGDLPTKEGSGSSVCLIEGH